MLLNPKTLDWLVCGPEDAPRRYGLAIPTVDTRQDWRKELKRAGAQHWGPMALLNVLESGVNAVTDGDTREAWLALVALHRGALAEFFTVISDIDIQTEDGRVAFKAAAEKADRSALTLSKVVDVIRAEYPPYADAIAEDGDYWPRAGTWGARLFLREWDGIDGEVKRIGNRVSDETLALIPEEDLPAIGRRISGLCQLSEPQRKNSSSPGHMPSGEMTSGVSTKTSPNSPKKTRGTSRNSASSVNGSIRPN